MSLVLSVAVHQIALASSGAGPLVPDPPPIPPPGLTRQVSIILGWIKWGTIIAGVIGLMICALMMMVGRRSRSTVAADGAAGIPWVLLGLMLASASSAIVGVFL